MRAPRLLIVLLALGTVGGFASGFRSVARWQYYKHHGGYSECGGGWRGHGWNGGYGNGWQQQQNVQPQQPAVIEKVVEKKVETPAPVVTPTANPTVNIYVNGSQVPAQQQQPAPTGEQQPTR